jgi:hypothetical protein
MLLSTSMPTCFYDLLFPSTSLSSKQAISSVAFHFSFSSRSWWVGRVHIGVTLYHDTAFSQS